MALSLECKHGQTSPLQKDSVVQVVQMVQTIRNTRHGAHPECLALVPVPPPIAAPPKMARTELMEGPPADIFWGDDWADQLAVSIISVPHAFAPTQGSKQTNLDAHGEPHAPAANQLR